MLRKLWAIIKIDFKNEFSYPATWIFFLVLPIVFTMVIGAALGGNQNQPGDQSDKDYRQVILAVDEDQSAFSRAFLEELSESDVIQLILLPTSVTNEDIQKTNALGWFIIPEGFESSVLENQTLTVQLHFGESSYSTIATENEIRSALGHTQAAIMAIQGSSLITSEETSQTDKGMITPTDELLEKANQLLNEEAMYQIVKHQPENINSTNGMMGFDQSSSGQIVTWTLITLIGGAAVFAQDRENGTYQRIKSTPTSKFTYFAGKLLSRFLMGMIQMSILVFFGMYILKVNWGNSPGLILLFLACFGLAGTAMGIMLGAFVKTSRQAGSLTPLFSMLMAALGGAWWPLEITPSSYQSIVRIFPSTWAMLGFNDIILKGQGFSGILTEILVLLGFAVLFTSVGVFKLSRSH